MRTSALLVGSACLLGAALACNTSAPLQVKAQYDDDASYSEIKTFRWLPGGRQDGPPLFRTRLTQAVEDELIGRGYVMAEEGTPDFWVNFHIGIAQRIDMANIGYGFQPGVDPIGSPPTAAVTRGSIMIDVLDPSTRELMWRGVASGLKTNPVKAGQRIREAVRGILAEFPPLT